jgi:hypothetical protein
MVELATKHFFSVSKPFGVFFRHRLTTSGFVALPIKFAARCIAVPHIRASGTLLVVVLATVFFAAASAVLDLTHLDNRPTSINCDGLNGHPLKF